jgi:ABC-type uncharacterized transport system permease subunit
MILSLGSPGGVAAPWLTLCSGVAFVAYLLAAWGPSGKVPATALLVAWLAQLGAILSDTLGWGQAVTGARFGFAPALSVTLWLVLAVYGIESRLVPLPVQRRILGSLGALAVLLAWVFPGEVHPQAPSPWAPLHWILGICSYGLFGVAVLHAAMLNASERRMRLKKAGGGVPAAPLGLPLLRLEKVTFRFVLAGFVVLSLAIGLGLYQNVAWRWDHKTVFSMLGWLVFAALLLGRQVLGWRGPRATRWLYIGAALLLLAYVGSRFVLEVLLQRPS